MGNHTPQSAPRKGMHYRPGELEVILSLAPTVANIGWLSRLLGRSEAAIEVVYKIAYEHGPFGKGAGIQEQKILQAKRRVGIAIGRKTPRNAMQRRRPEQNRGGHALR